ncbi:MAG: hypothetical protein EBX35_12330, partial [Planctomycetia bacterium]|nr:hypothetical protein [Planctomycetia bacterium]
FEAQTLAQWITSLQPHFTNVWGFQAINMAYNISVMAEDPFDRWGWVSRGIELLRTQGIPLNPNAPKLYEELGWILMDKVGGDRDREHWFLKQRLVSDMQEVLGDKNYGRTAVEVVEGFQKVADAPDTLDELVATHPEVQPVLDLIEQLGARPDEEFLRMLGLVVMVNASGDASIMTGRGLPEGTNRALVGGLQSVPELGKPCFELLIPHLQKRVLLDHYRMDARKMLALMEKYGPMDWRHPSAQGIYWMEEGYARSLESRNREGRNELLVIKRRLNMIAELMRTGRINYDAVSDRIDLLPDPRFIPAYEAALTEAIGQIRSEAGVTTQFWGRADVDDLLKGWERFLNEATIMAYVYGDEPKATECFQKLVKLAQEQGMGDQPIYRESLQTFVTLRLGEVMKLDLNNTRQFVDGMLNRALVDGLAQGRLDIFNRFLKMAYKVYDKRYSVSDPTKLRVQQQMEIGSFPDLVDASFEAMMRQGKGPVLMRARIWAWAPDRIKERAWPKLKDSLAEQATAAGLDPARAFPKPKDYVEEAEDPLKEPGDTAPAVPGGTTPDRPAPAGASILHAPLRTG